MGFLPPARERRASTSLHPSLEVRPRVAVGLIFLTALFVRLLHVASYDAAAIYDMAVYVEIATKNLTLANLFRPEGVSRMPPGYPLFLKPFFLLADPEPALRATRVAQAFLGAWTCVLLYRLTRRIHSRRAGLVAALMCCFYPHFIFYTSATMSEDLFIPLSFASLLLFLRAAEHPGRSALIRAGAVAAVGVLVRPAALALAPVAFLASWRAATTQRGRLLALLMVVGGGLMVLGPWGLRNKIATGHFDLIAPTGGYALIVGNQPDATGRFILGPEPPEGDLWSRSEYFNGKALDFVSNDPWGALYVALHLKWQAFWALEPPWPLYSINPCLFYGGIFFPCVSWRAALVLGLMGFGVLLGRGRRSWITPACMAAYAGFYMLYYGQPRFRLPAEGYFLCWAGIAVAEAVRALPAIRRLRAPAWAAAISIGLVAVLAQAGMDAAASRDHFERSDSLIARAGQFPILSSKRSMPVFGESPLPLDRSRGRYLLMSFSAYKQGLEGAGPYDAAIQITFLDRAGRPRPPQESATYSLEALPAGRWCPIDLKVHIPPAAASCRIEVIPDRQAPEVVLIDQATLRYASGNDLFLEFLFPYLQRSE